MSDREYEYALIVLRKEIEDLDNKAFRSIMRKTLDRKNFTNQKQYLNKIFHDSGLSKSIKIDEDENVLA